MNCLVCNIEFESSRTDAKYCSPKCRKIASRVSSVTDNVTLSNPDVTLNFEFYTITKGREPLRDHTQEPDTKSIKRTTRYWYDVPLGAIPVIQKDWPEMPTYMNGRQYFLWWKNEFEVKDSTPVIHNPFPSTEGARYEMGGSSSRKWGA